ncbi:uncharacterized protein LOC134206340 isoform X2 [Armigeres subalbatus]|uniref:uncharacterized protein LOC134206340 isoform X2 n=1 Tax=Armigeres subalbatus TaxID=124917 RepID=UPI002ED1C758
MNKNDDSDTDHHKQDAVSIFSGSSESDRKGKSYDFGFSLPSPQQPQPMDVDTSGGPILMSPLIATPRPSDKKRKLNSGRSAKLKIRKLAKCEEEFDGVSSRSGQIGMILRKVFGLRMVICYSLVVLVAVSVAMIRQKDLREEFFKRYMKQYNSLLYGVEDYCSQEFDFTATAAALSAGMVGQLEATGKLVEMVNRRRNERCVSFALFGSTGVGKSLMANIIANQFQWQSNVHRFFWDSTFTPEKRFERFQSFLYGIRHGRDVDLRCGRNLIIVDHLGSGDMDMINKIDARLRFVADKDDVHFLVVYAFQGSLIDDDPEAIKRLNRNIVQVSLRSMDKHDLMLCIKLESADLEVNLDERPELLEELIGSLDVERYGCKAVRAKLALYSHFSKVDES